MSTTQFDSAKAAERWTAFLEAVPVRAIRSDTDYDAMVVLMVTNHNA